MAEQQIAFGAAIMLLTASPARADPCEGRLPSRPGQQFGGTVRYVGDGDGFCVGNSADPNTWIEVRLADFDAPELHSPDGRRSKALLEQVAFGQTVSCEARRGRSDRVIVYDLLRTLPILRARGQSQPRLLWLAAPKDEHRCGEKRRADHQERERLRPKLGQAYPFQEHAEDHVHVMAQRAPERESLQ